MEILFGKKFWNLKQPKLLISITGGTHFLYHRSSFVDYFSKGLAKAAMNTGEIESLKKNYFIQKKPF
jgi:hypothetical protein